MKKDILRIQDNLNRELAAAEQTKKKYATELEKFAAEKENLLQKELRQATQKVESLIQETKVQEVFKRHEKLQKIKYELPEVIKATGERRPTNETIPVATADDFAKTYPPGTHVFIPSLNRDGIIQGRPNAKDEVPIMSQSMRLMLNWRELKPSRVQQNPTQQILRKTGHFSFAPTDDDRVVDVRGLTVEDATSQLEIQLDAASLGSEDRVKIIHGHGTDTLKRAVRSYLSRSVYVKKWTAGTAESGGDGITWVELKG
jgi:DNA mismatch repair protein MutS2